MPTLKERAKLAGIKYPTVLRRVSYYGMPVEEALTKPTEPSRIPNLVCLATGKKAATGHKRATCKGCRRVRGARQRERLRLRKKYVCHDESVD